jgi:hypothetical protein
MRAKSCLWSLRPDIVSTQCHRALRSLSVLGGGVIAAQIPLTIPKLLLILEVVRHFKCHTVFADQPPKSLSPATQALGVIVRGAKQLVVFSCSHQRLRRTAAVSASLFLIRQACLDLTRAFLSPHSTLNHPSRSHISHDAMMNCRTSQNLCWVMARVMTVHFGPVGIVP